MSTERNFQQMQNYLNGQLEAQKETLRTLVPAGELVPAGGTGEHDDERLRSLENRVEKLEINESAATNSVEQLKAQIAVDKSQFYNDQADLSVAFSAIEQRINNVEATVINKQDVESLIETSHNAIKSQAEQMVLDQGDSINQLDRKFSERYRQLDHFTSDQIELKKGITTVKSDLDRVWYRVEELETNSMSNSAQVDQSYVDNYMAKTKEKLVEDVNKVASDLDDLSRSLIEIQYQIADITIPAGSGLDSSDIDIIKAQLARYRKALMESINTGKANGNIIKETQNQLGVISRELDEHTGSIESVKDELSSISEEISDVTISLNADLLLTQELLNSTINQVDEQENLFTRLESSVARKSDVHRNNMMIASNITQVYNLIDNEISSLRSDFGAQVGNLQMGMQNVDRQYTHLDEKTNIRFDSVDEAISNIQHDVSTDNQEDSVTLNQLTEQASVLEKTLFSLENQLSKQNSAVEAKLTNWGSANQEVNDQLRSKLETMRNKLGNFEIEQTAHWSSYLQLEAR